MVLVPRPWTAGTRNGDRLFDGHGQLDTLARTLTRYSAHRNGVPGGEEWPAWGQAVEQAPELGELVQRRGPISTHHDPDDPPTVDDHLQALRAAGFTEAGTVWQHGENRVLVAFRGATLRTNQTRPPVRSSPCITESPP